jgi:chaperone modulatory protein CbpM
MNSEIQKILSGGILEEESSLTLGDLCNACSVRAIQIVALVEEGVLDPCGRDPRQWRFTGSNLTRARVALRLQRDLEVNLSGAALILDLLEEIDELDRRVKVLER